MDKLKQLMTQQRAGLLVNCRVCWPPRAALTGGEGVQDGAERLGLLGRRASASAGSAAGITVAASQAVGALNELLLEVLRASP